MAVYLLAGIILGGLLLFIVISIRGIRKSKSEIERMFKWSVCPLKVFCGEGELKGDHKVVFFFFKRLS